MDNFLFVTSNFPLHSLQHSYERKLQKKVLTCDFIFAIPYGTKSFLWATKTKEEHKFCFFIEVDPTKKSITSVKEIDMQFPDDFYQGQGTLLFGTCIVKKTTNENKAKRRNMFCIDNIYFFKGENISSKNWLHKFDTISTVLESVVYCKTLNLGIPLFGRKLNDVIMESSENKVYKTRYFALRNQKRNDTFIFKVIPEITKEREKEKEKEKEVPLIFDQTDMLNVLFNKSGRNDGKRNDGIRNDGIRNDGIRNDGIRNESSSLLQKKTIMMLRPDLQNDIYHVFSFEKGTKEYTKFEGNALIPDYETSVLLNSVFRKIKENNSLDLLEESDDEMEFEDEREDKFVYLEKEATFECVFNMKFKKWVPVSRIK